MVPRQEGKREEKPEEAGHRRRKAAMVPRREVKREEKPEEAGHRRKNQVSGTQEKKSSRGAPPGDEE